MPYSLGEGVTASTTLHEIGVDTEGTFSLSRSDTDSGSQTQTDNQVNGDYTVSQSGTDTYDFAETGHASSGSYSLSESGTRDYDRTTIGNQTDGSYSLTDTGDDSANFNLSGSYITTCGTHTQTLSFTEALSVDEPAYSLVETGNSATGDFSRTESSNGTYTRTETGNGRLGSGSGSIDYTVHEVGNYLRGSLESDGEWQRSLRSDPARLRSGDDEDRADRSRRSPGLKNKLASLFPKAIFTLHLIHVIEQLWTLGRHYHKEGSTALTDWVEQLKVLVYAGHAACLVDRLTELRRQTAAHGPATKARRECLRRLIKYLSSRLSMMQYDRWLKADLAIASVQVEGAVRQLVAEGLDRNRCESTQHAVFICCARRRSFCGCGGVGVASPTRPDWQKIR